MQAFLHTLSAVGFLQATLIVGGLLYAVILLLMIICQAVAVLIKHFF